MGAHTAIRHIRSEQRCIISTLATITTTKTVRRKHFATTSYQLTPLRQQSLHALDLSPDTSPAILCVLYQFLLMILHANLDMITRFAGKCGEEEARRAYTQLQPWSQTKEARVAVSHAGQLLRAVRAIPPYQIRGQDAFMLYHAIMVLWTYSMMMKGQAKRTATSTPARGQVHSVTLPSEGNMLVFLDDPPSNSSLVNGFISKSDGYACLHVPVPSARRNDNTTSTPPQDAAPKQGVCDLRSPAQIMGVGIAILEETHPQVERKRGPPLLRALCGLMEELGNLR